MTERKTIATTPYTIGVAPFRPGDESSFGGSFTEKPEDLNRPDPINVIHKILSNMHPDLSESWMMITKPRGIGILN